MQRSLAPGPTVITKVQEEKPGLEIKCWEFICR